MGPHPRESDGTPKSINQSCHFAAKSQCGRVTIFNLLAMGFEKKEKKAINLESKPEELEKSIIKVNSIYYFQVILLTWISFSFLVLIMVFFSFCFIFSITDYRLLVGILCPLWRMHFRGIKSLESHMHSLHNEGNFNNLSFELLSLQMLIMFIFFSFLMLF